jgi:hypothetical protein
MTFVKAFGVILFVLVVAAVGVVLVVVAPRWYAAAPQAPRTEASPAGESATRTIKATLFYVAEDGGRLVAVQREVPYGEGVDEQARRIVEAEIATAPVPLASALPAATTLRALYVGERGDAYVDLSREVASAHPGGTLNELLTVYAVVDALTVNLPAISSVQILVDGHEVDTLAGHVDLRRPLVKNTHWVRESQRAPGQ